MCTSPDKAFLAAAGHKHIRLYELGASSQVPASTIEAHTGNVTGIAYFRDGRFLISSSEDGSLKIWDMRSMQRRKQFVVRTAVNCFALHPDQSKIIAGDQSGRLTVWDTVSGADECVQELVPGGDIGIRSVVISQDPNGPIVAANNAGDVFVLELVDGNESNDDVVDSDTGSEGGAGGGGSGGGTPSPTPKENTEAEGEQGDAKPAATAAAGSGLAPKRLRLAHHFKAHNKVCVMGLFVTL